MMAERGRREQIIEAAKELFREKGYHATTIRDIAQRAGMLSGSLYAHIKTKEDLLFEITEEVAHHFVHSLEPIVASQGSATEKFHAALTSHIAVVTEHLDAAAVFSHEWKALTEERKDVIQRERDRYEELWAAIIAEGVKTGEFHSEFVRFARIVTLSVANWLYQWYDPEGLLKPNEVAERLAAVLMRGLHT
jgi:TetR/AcrR family transcriptional regulator, cholesterol catabolism regulator